MSAFFFLSLFPTNMEPPDVPLLSNEVKDICDAMVHPCTTTNPRNGCDIPEYGGLAAG